MATNPMTTPPASPPPRTASEIAREVALGRKARSLLEPGLRPGQFLARLVQGRHHADAIRFMAHSLLNREAVWWACLCARHATGEGAPPEHRRALGAAVRWVIDPSDANRSEAGAAALAAGKGVPARCAARAASHAAGPTPPRATPPPAPGAMPALILPSLAARLCAAGVLHASARGTPAEVSLNYRQFIALGLDVAYGTNRWE